MLGIIGAMGIEVSTLQNELQNKKIDQIAGMKFHCGYLNSCKAVIALCRAGKINAAICAQIMIDKYHVDNIINVGVGCSLSNNVTIGDIVIARDVCQYDVDFSPLGSPRGLIDGFRNIKITTSDILSNILASTADKLGYTVHRGTIASGDLFIASNELKGQIVKNFDAICGEMEGGAIGQVCCLNDIPFTVLRSISDGGDETANITFEKFCCIAAEKTTSIILDTTRDQSFSREII